MASSAPRTPSTPSNLPPVGWVSRCEPMRSAEDLGFARPAREHGADFVDRYGAAERLALRLEPVAHLPVEIGERQAANAALRRRANLRRVHQRVPKPLTVDL